MSVANWPTGFLAESAKDGDLPADGQGDRAGIDDSQGTSVLRTEPRPFVGSRIGAYLVTKWLGAGGVGEVFKAVDVMLKREVAIKLLRPELASDPLFLERFRREAQLHAKLSHPNVASVHAFLHEGEKQFMVMEYVPGISLDEFLRSGGPVPPQRALDIFRRALDGIAHAHGCGIVHRDIKPANLMLADNGQVKVMDFGIARALDCQEHLTRHGQVAGTAKAMSPEQIRGGQADVRSDIYSLGIVLYTLLAGRAPFEGKSDHALMVAQLEQAPPPLRDLVDGLSPRLEAAVMRALEKDPAARFQSVADFGRAIDACLAEFAVLPAPVDDRLAAPTSSRTVINPVLQGARRLPAGAKDRAAGAARGPRLAWPAWRLPRRLDRRASVAGLALFALIAGAILAWPLAGQWLSRDAAPARPLVAVPAARSEPPARVEPAPARESAEPDEPVPTPAPPRIEPIAPRTLAITRLPGGAGTPAADEPHRFRPGERILLRIAPSRDANVYCYLQDEAGHIVRFFPNRFRTSAWISPAAPLEIPGRMPFELVANRVNVTETVACFASERELSGELPAAVVGTDFVRLPVGSLDEVRSAFARVAADTLAHASFRVEPR